MSLGPIGLIFSALEALILGVPFASDSAKQTEKNKALEQFRSLRIGVKGDGIAFDGSDVQTLKSEETFRTHNGAVLDYVLTVFVVTSANQYFLLKSNSSGKPFIKELSAERARLVLKDKFQAYARSDA